MSQDPTVSIIINNHNYGRYLPAAIESGLRQTYPAVEVIVVDDGSTDCSRDVICRYEDRVLPILKANGGQASAFNAGFAQSRGDVVIFLDADDVLLPDTARRVADAFKAAPCTAKVQYRLEVIDAHDVPTGVIKPPRHLPLESGDLRRHVLTFPFDVAWTATSGNAFAAWVLDAIFPIPEQAYGKVGADWYVSHLTPLFGPVVFLESVGARYRVHGSNHYQGVNPTINLAHIHQTIAYAHQTVRYIETFAEQLDLNERFENKREMLSVSMVGQRLISLKLAPEEHPVEDDTPGRLLRLGVIASLQRFDVSWPMRVLLVLWFVAMVAAPRPIARRLAEKFLFPETREQINRLLATLHRFPKISEL